MIRLSAPELILVLIIVIIVLGIGRVGKIGGELRTPIRRFPEGLSGGKDDEKKTEATDEQQG